MVNLARGVRSPAAGAQLTMRPLPRLTHHGVVQVRHQNEAGLLHMAEGHLHVVWHAAGVWCARQRQSRERVGGEGGEAAVAKPREAANH